MESVRRNLAGRSPHELHGQNHILRVFALMCLTLLWSGFHKSAPQ